MSDLNLTGVQKSLVLSGSAAIVVTALGIGHDLTIPMSLLFAVIISLPVLGVGLVLSLAGYLLDSNTKGQTVKESNPSYEGGASLNDFFKGVLNWALVICFIGFIIAFPVYTIAISLVLIAFYLFRA